MSVKPKVIVGTWIRPDGTPAAGAVLTLLLSQDATVPGLAQVGHFPAVITLDANGSIPSSAASPGPEVDTHLYANDQMLPLNTHYIVSVVDDVFGQIYFERLVLAGDSPIDLTTLAPVQR
jgi:hypothetical protein